MRYNQFKKPDFFKKPGYYALSHTSKTNSQNICGIRRNTNSKWRKLLRQSPLVIINNFFCDFRNAQTISLNFNGIWCFL